MLLKYLYALTLLAVASANLFDFIQNQFHHQQPEGGNSFEQQVLESKCAKYLCPNTMECVSSPKDCSCPFPSSQLRCILPNGEPLCISKPAGDFGGVYDDLKSNWKADAKDDNVRDCGWVSRAWSGQ